jgi:hypothetical protein
VLLYRLFRHGYTYRRIPLTKGWYAKVDVDNFYRFIKHKWQACPNREKGYYARRSVTSKAGGKQIHMHRVVLNAPEGMQIDHINGDITDNRRANLRFANSSQNCCNRSYKQKTSKYKGVQYVRSEKCYRVNINKDCRRIYVGRFKSEIEAAKAYDAAARKYHGEFARLNFPVKKRINWFRFIKKLRKLSPAHNK